MTLVIKKTKHQHTNGEEDANTRTTKTAQHNEAQHLAKLNEWHDLAYFCILETQNPMKEKTMDSTSNSHTG